VQPHSPAPRSIGPTTNRALLLQLLAQLCDVDGPDDVVDTGWLDRTQMLGDGPQPSRRADRCGRGRRRRQQARRPLPDRLAQQPVAAAQPRPSASTSCATRSTAATCCELVVDDTPVELDQFTRDALARIATAVVDDTVHVAGGRSPSSCRRGSCRPTMPVAPARRGPDAGQGDLAPRRRRRHGGRRASRC
jgi:hypothetical protein